MDHSTKNAPGMTDEQFKILMQGQEAHFDRMELLTANSNNSQLQEYIDHLTKCQAQASNHIKLTNRLNMITTLAFVATLATIVLYLKG